MADTLRTRLAATLAEHHASTTSQWLAGVGITQWRCSCGQQGVEHTWTAAATSWLEAGDAARAQAQNHQAHHLAMTVANWLTEHRREHTATLGPDALSAANFLSHLTTEATR